MAQHDYDRIGYGLAALDRGFTASRTLAALHAATLRTTPRTTFVYSNLGIRVIGYGLEHQYRSSFAALLDSVIFRPLGMHETGFDPTAAMMARLVTPYNRYGHAQPYHDASGRDLIARSAELIRHVGGYLRAVRVTGGHA